MYQTINGRRGYRFEIKNKKLHQNANIKSQSNYRSGCNKDKINPCFGKCIKVIGKKLNNTDSKTIKIVGVIAASLFGALAVKNSLKR